MQVQTDLSLAVLTAPNVGVDRLRSAIPTRTGVDINRKFLVDGNHWQDGEGWVGPGPRPSDPTFRDIMPLIEKAFVSKNVLDEIIDRHVSAMLGKEPRWSWVPIQTPKEGEDISTADSDAIDELEAALTTWWDRREAHRLLKSMVYKMLWGYRGVWRLYVPSGLSDSAGRVSATTLDDALALLYLDVPEPENAGVWEDPETKTRVGIVIYKDSAGKEHAEVTYVNKDSKQTIINVLPGDVTVSNDFQGNMPVGCISLDELWCSEQMRSLQRALNMTLTLLEKGLVDNAFLERILTNALPPGHWEFEDQPDPVTGAKVRKAYVVDKHITGGRQTTYLMGVDYDERKADGSVSTVIKDPGVVFRDPTDPSGIIKGSEFWYMSLIGEARQDHVLIAKDSTPSGKSREQARGDFIDSTKDTELQTELAGRSLLVTLVAMAEAFMSKPGQWTKKFKPVFKCRTSYGPLSVEERAQNVAEAESGFMADDTAMSLNGVDDVDAERALIQEQPRATLALAKSQAEVVDLWITAGFSREVALSQAGFSDEDIKEIMKREAAAVVVPLGPGDPGFVDPNAPPPTNPPTPPAPPKPKPGDPNFGN